MKQFSLIPIIAVIVATTLSAQASLIQWLTTTNVASVQTNATGTVTNWLDSSGSGNATANAGAIVGTPLYPSTSLSASGLPGVDMGATRNGFRLWSSAAQDSWLDFTGAASSKSGFAVLVAFKCDGIVANASGFDPVFANHGAPTNANSFGLSFLAPSGQLSFYALGAQRPRAGTPVQAGDTVVMAFNYDAASGAYEFWDSKNNSSTNGTIAANGNFSSVQTLYLGTSENSGQWMHGGVFEVRVYDNVLTSNDLATARQQMTAQWASPPANPLPPTWVLAVPDDSAAQLSWANPNPSGVVSNYYVYRSLTSGSGYTAIATNSGTSYTDAGLTNGTTYYYVLKAVGTNGLLSVFSAEKAVKPMIFSTNTVLIQHLDADVPGSVSNVSSQVVTWLDQTTNANNGIPMIATPTNGVGTPRYPSTSLSGSGKAGVDLGTSSWPALTITNRSGVDLFTGAQQTNWLDFAGAAQANGGFSALVAFKADSILTNNSRNAVLVNHGNQATPNAFGLRFDDFGTMEVFLGGTTHQKSGPKVNAGDTVVYAFTYDARTGAIQFWDSKSQSSLLATNVAFGNFASTQNLRLGTSDNNGQRFDGMVGEVKIYKGKLSSTALVAEGQSLATKWGAESIINTNAVLIQHLDADVPSSVIDVGGQVLTWFDQSGNLNDASPTTGTGAGTPLYPSASLSGSGKAGVDLGTNTWPVIGITNRSGMDLFAAASQTNWLDFTGAAFTNGGFSALVAFKADSIRTDVSARNPVLVNHGNSAIANSFGLRFNAAGAMEAFLGGQTYLKTNNAPVKAGDTVVYGFNYDELTGVIQFWDSKNNSALVATNTPFGNFASTQKLRLGTSDNNAQQFDGMVGEVKIYRGKLSTAALLNEGQALATKWGATLAKTNDFYLLNLVLSSGTLSPTFSSNVLSYAASVPNSVSNLYVNPTAASAGSVISVRINGGAYTNVTSGSFSGELPLNEGTNTVEINVTAENQAFSQTYTVNVTRASGSPTPESITRTVSGGNLILSWTQPAWKLATGTNVTAITNIIPSATSPYTNSLSEPKRFYRLVYP